MAAGAVAVAEVMDDGLLLRAVVVGGKAAGMASAQLSNTRSVSAQWMLVSRTRGAGGDEVVVPLRGRLQSESANDAGVDGIKASVSQAAHTQNLVRF